MRESKLPLKATLLFLIVLAGCSGEDGGTGWAKAGSTYRQFLSDRFACLGISPSPTAAQVFSCMQSRGYHRSDDGYTAPASAQVPLAG